jgi:hypothetical protein
MIFLMIYKSVIFNMNFYFVQGHFYEIERVVMAPPGDETAPHKRRLHVEIRSVTKDSLGITWHSDLDESDSKRRKVMTGDQSTSVISGYKVRYQAVGSTFVQISHLLRVSINID